MSQTYRRSRSAMLGMGGLILALAAGWFWWDEAVIDPPRGDSSVRVVTGPASVAHVGARAVPGMVNEDRIAASERRAVSPPPGGPGPGDTRPRTAPPVTRAVGEGEGYRLHGTGPGFEAAGFREGDLLVRVDGAEGAALAPGTRVPDLLVPGAVVEVDRDGERFGWRIGGKAE